MPVKSRPHKSNTSIKPALLSILLLVLLWEVSARLVDKPALFPTLTGLAGGLLELLQSSAFYLALWHTLLRGVIGFILAFMMALGLSAIALHHPFWKSFFHPLVVIIRSVPVISIVLIALLWLSPPHLPAFIALFTMFPVLYQSMLSGLEHTDPKLVEMARVYRKSGLGRFQLIYLPSARKLILSGVATAMGFGWRAVIIGEVLSGPLHGIGTGMKRAQSYIDMTELLSWTILAVLISFAFESLLKQAAKRSNHPGLKVNLKSTQSATHTPAIKTIKAINLNKSFNKVPVIVQLNEDFSNEKIQLLGSASGTGKTTLLKLIGRLHRMDSGELHLPADARIGWAFQDLRLIPWLTVEENVCFAFPHYPHISSGERERCRKLLTELELLSQIDKLPEELSGGQQQRVAMARAMVMPNDVLLLDEPLNGLDTALKDKTIAIISDYITQYQPIVLWATHEELGGRLQLPSRPVKLTKVDEQAQRQ